jgi:hypothetical protein
MKSLFTYALAENISLLGFLGIAFYFLAAIEDEFPPRPAHLVLTLKF